MNILQRKNDSHASGQLFRRIVLSILLVTFLVFIPRAGFTGSLRTRYGIPPLTKKNIQNWNVMHFRKAPRIKADLAKRQMLSGKKMLIIDAQSSKKTYKRRHICGAIRPKGGYLRINPRKVPKNYLVISYCD